MKVLDQKTEEATHRLEKNILLEKKVFFTRNKEYLLLARRIKINVVYILENC